ncbi:MAG TPA: hypothetical protein VGE31_00505 [Candidatus Paceibacterota bacterium]
MSQTDDHGELKALIIENQRLLTENHVLLKKMRTVALWDFGIRMLITAFFLGLPLLAYFYIFEQYSESIMRAFQSFQELSTGHGLEGMLIHNQPESGN